MDGLCAIPIKGDKNFEKLRSKINLDRTLNLTSDFDLHPALSNYKKLWDENLASAVHATSIPYTGRSHFDGQNLMESGGRIPYEIKTGWLGRGMKIEGITGNGLALTLRSSSIMKFEKAHGSVAALSKTPLSLERKTSGHALPCAWTP